MLSIIIPTYNEKNNLSELVSRLKAISQDLELIVIDDNSPDGTAEFARHLGLKVIVRPTREGLSSAVIDGFKIAKGTIICVLDADLSHPPEVIPEMLEKIKSGQADFVIGSRFVPGGGSRNWSFMKKLFSELARLAAKPLTDIKDFTSGFFMLKRSVVEGVTLNPIGFKICLEIITKGKYKNAVEVPIVFADCSITKSKMGIAEIFEYFIQVGLLYVDKITGKTKRRK
ncbi:MAG: dolichol monophosphate mannose synthase [Candidatus Saganbacteria bacterium]|uniref:Dolichol monophosphate mannose synthase n=1 Tax=Candidatus Saganbacteria bacterium TaxID=2575572 RepID=A0A833L267_UNCSA|nr:MAG: dolichol monophosphate mannose synthase [Candidatus Saganbacteria bacterium]